MDIERIHWLEKIDESNTEELYAEIACLTYRLIDAGQNTRYTINSIMDFYEKSGVSKDILFISEEVSSFNEEIISEMAESDLLIKCKLCENMGRCLGCERDNCYRDAYCDMRYSGWNLSQPEEYTVLDVLNKDKHFFSLSDTSSFDFFDRCTELEDISDILDRESDLRERNVVRVFFNNSQQVLLPSLIQNNCIRDGGGNLLYYNVKGTEINMIKLIESEDSEDE